MEFGPPIRMLHVYLIGYNTHIQNFSSSCVEEFVDEMAFVFVCSIIIIIRYLVYCYAECILFFTPSMPNKYFSYRR